MIEPILGALKWLGGLFFKSHTASQVHSREYDIAVFQRGDATVNETFLDNLLNGNLYNRWCWLDDIRAVRRLCQDFRREGNQFLDRKVQKAAVDSMEKLRAVDTFVAKHCFTPMHETGQVSLSLYPELRHSDDPAQRKHYEQYASELNELTDAAWLVYRHYRATVRKRLKV